MPHAVHALARCTLHAARGNSSLTASRALCVLQVRSTWEPEGKGTWISEQPEELGPPAGGAAARADESDEALSRGVALSVAGSSSANHGTVTVICSEVADEERGQRARLALQARVDKALDAEGINRLSAADSLSPLSVSVHIAEEGKLNAAVAAIFGSIAD